MAERNFLAFLKNALSVTGVNPQEQTALENLMWTRLLTAGLTVSNTGVIAAAVPIAAAADLTNVTGVLAGASGGTGVANTGFTLTLGGNLVTSGAFATTLTATATTTITLPTTGTLLTTAGSGTGLVFTTGSITALGGNLSTLGAFTIALTATGATTVTLPTSGTLLTTTGSLAGLTGTLLAATQDLITRLGTITSGVWNAGAVTASGLITPSSGILGVSTNSSATAGNVGEEIVATVVRGSAISLTTAVAANVTSISLTAGDWDLSGFVGYVTGTQINMTYGQVSPSTVSATMATPSFTINTNGVTQAADNFVGIYTQRVSLAGTTTYYLVALAAFGSSTVTAYGQIRARRLR